VLIEDRLDYYEVFEKYAERRINDYKCLICGMCISATREGQSPLDVNIRSNMGNARGAMTNHLKGHMRRREV